MREAGESVTSKRTMIGAAHTGAASAGAVHRSAVAARISPPAPQEASPGLREATAEAAVAARGEAAPGEEVLLQAGVAAVTGEADEAGPEVARGPLRRPLQKED